MELILVVVRRIGLSLSTPQGIAIDCIPVFAYTREFQISRRLNGKESRKYLDRLEMILSS